MPKFLNGHLNRTNALIVGRKLNANGRAPNSFAREGFLEFVCGFHVTIENYGDRSLDATGTGDGRADAFGAAGNHNHFVFKLKIHSARTPIRSSATHSAHKSFAFVRP